MDEKELKTSTKQRVFIILIAVLMVGSIIASYAAIVISGARGRHLIHQRWMKRKSRSSKKSMRRNSKS